MGVIQWFPGHMAKARRILAENLSNVDVVVELCDARIPYSSRNPEIVKVIGKKPSVMVCNKADLADPVMSDFWKTYYRKQGIEAVFTDSRKGEGVKKVTAAIKNAMAEKIRRQEEKGRVNAQIRAMIVGIPNVGKSSFINRVAESGCGHRGQARRYPSKQWLKMASDIYLLDTRGCCGRKSRISAADTGWPAPVRLRRTFWIIRISPAFCWTLQEAYPEALRERFKIPADCGLLDRMELWSSAGESGAVW